MRSLKHAHRVVRVVGIAERHDGKRGPHALGNRLVGALDKRRSRPRGGAHALKERHLAVRHLEQRPHTKHSPNGSNGRPYASASAQVARASPP